MPIKVLVSLGTGPDSQLDVKGERNSGQELGQDMTGAGQLT